MTDIKLTALSSGSAIADADLFYSSQSGVSVKQAASAYQTYLAGKGIFNFNAIATNWYMPFGYNLGAGGAVVAGNIRLHPLVIPRTCTVDSLGVRITTLAASGNIQLALYANNYTTGRPTGNALSSTASISTGSTGLGSAAMAASVPITPGIYWAGMNADASAGGVAVLNAHTAVCPFMSAIIGSATEANVTPATNQAQLTLLVSQAFGTWPDLTGASFTESTNTAYGIIHYRVVTVP